MASLSEPAHAKINLALHVTGQRSDGYHLIDSLVTFTEAGDRIDAAPAEADRFTLSGPFAASLQGADETCNLVLKARDALRAAFAARGESAPFVHLHLEKNLPVSSGIGGGSADAAATIRVLERLWQAHLPDAERDRLALKLGADLPMCLRSRPLIARGIGEEITPVHLPALPILLVNPLKPVSTPAIFRLLTNKENPPMPAFGPGDTLASLKPLRNDLQGPAERLEPAISTVLERLAASGAPVVRMSGSGATCFALYADHPSLYRAAEALKATEPDWFICPTLTLA